MIHSCPRGVLYGFLLYLLNRNSLSLSYHTTLSCRTTQVHVAGRHHHPTLLGPRLAFLLLLEFCTTGIPAMVTMHPRTLLIAVDTDLNPPPSCIPKELDAGEEPSLLTGLGGRTT